MATIVLSAAGSAVGGSIGGPVGSILGAQVGRTIGGFVDQQIFGDSGKNTEITRSKGPRLSDLSVQTSTYGKMIPILYGTARMAGNMIWSLPIKEIATTSTSTSSTGSSGGGGGTTTTTTVTYSYTATMAIAICEGAIDSVIRVWADAKLLNLGQGTFRIYKGDETQLPDTIIEASQGVGKTPAYRGLAYVVIEDFPLADFGNRIPNFTFEVKRRIPPLDDGTQSVEEAISSIILIPGSGEFVYDTQIQQKVTGVTSGMVFAPTGQREVINAHTHEAKANALVALDQLEEALPNIGWVSVVVGWFGDNIDAGVCTLKPGVEYNSGATTEPEVWSVAGFTRSTAYLISTDAGGNPVYGGTVDDQSLVRLLGELRSRGYSIMLLPMFFMDTAGKPWRGRLTGSAADVASFFTKTNGYNAMITHYATLTAGKVEAFAIGSELIGLTQVMGSLGVFPAVDALVSLAATVRGIMGGSVKLTYAADWSEYHHTDSGWYNLDPLWASSNIDVVGIDAYFPLTNAPQNGYDIAAVQAGWTSGEGYDFKGLA